MTKKEILEDLALGNVVKFNTESGEVFEGEIIDFGETGLKISIYGTSRSKRIIYDRIAEYDVEDLRNNIDGCNEKKKVLEKAKSEKIIEELPQKVEEKEQGLNISTDKNNCEVSREKKLVDRNDLFLEKQEEETISEIRNELYKRINEKYKSDINRINNILSYAKKMNEYALTTDRVAKIIAEYKKLGSSDRGFYSMIGTVYQELEELQQAAEYYNMGGAYDKEFLLVRNCKSDVELFKIAILATEYNDECQIVTKWLCEYALNYDNYSVLRFVLMHAKKYVKDIVFFWYADKEEINNLPDKVNLFSEDNVNYLKSLTEGDVTDASINEIISSASVQESLSLNDDYEEEVDEDKRIKGTISYYNKERGFGSIKSYDGDNIHFHITQVKDFELQRILSTENNYRRKVTYVLGLNFKGEIAADAIELDIDYNGYDDTEDESFEGFLVNYDVDKEYGIIQSGDEKYKFFFSQIRDPLLKAEIMSEPYKNLDLDVKFYTSDDKIGTKTKKAIDIVGKKKYSQKDIDFYIEQNLTTKKELDRWFSASKVKNIGFYRPSVYMSLNPIVAKKERTNANETNISYNKATYNNIECSRPDKEKRGGFLSTKDEPNQFMNSSKSFLTENTALSQTGYFQNTNIYIAEQKNGNDEVVDVDLDKTESLFLSKYIEAKLHAVNLSSTFNKVNVVYTNLRDGAFIGNADDVENAINHLNSILQRGNTVSAEVRRGVYIGIARIILDYRKNNENNNDTKVYVGELQKYIGRYARYTADTFVEDFKTIESIRYMYILALKNLVKKDTIETAAAMNMLIASFFPGERSLKDELHKMNFRKLNDTYFKRDCVSVKDFLIATFMLEEKQEDVNSILKKIYNFNKLKENCKSLLEEKCVQGKAITSFYDFEMLWKTAKRMYYTNVEKIGKEVTESVNEYYMVESIEHHVSKIKEFMDLKLLWNQDELVLKLYMNILLDIEKTFEKYTIKEKIEGFKWIESKIDELKQLIENAPTELSYDYLYIYLDDLKNSIRVQLDEVYHSSRPECDIFLSNDSVYVNEKTVKIAITFKNAVDKQDADAVEIEFESSEGATFIKCEKKFTSIRSGEAQDYIALFQLNDKVITDGQFEVIIALKYQYKESAESIGMFDGTEILPVNISDKDNFVRIENKYNSIIRSAGVQVKELFKGRDELIDSICESLSTAGGIMTKNRGIVLWGQRRVGKNSVKDYLKEKIKTAYPGSYLIFEMGSVGGNSDLRKLLISIINHTVGTLEIEYGDIYEALVNKGMVLDNASAPLEKTDNYMPEFSKFMRRLSVNLKQISDPEKNIPLFFIDEFSYLYEWIEKGELDGKVFMRFWKSFIQDYGICAIIIAQDNIPVWKSKYENEFACMDNNEITYLDYEGAKALICEPCQTNGKVLFTQEAVNLIYEWTKGSAYLIVIFCKHVIDYLNNNFIEKATKTIVQLVFEREFLDKKNMFNSGDFEPQITDVAIVGDEGKMIIEQNKRLLKDIAASTIASSQVKIEDLKFFEGCKDDEMAKKVFDRLRDRKIIEVESNKYCSINMPLLKLYLLREQSLLNKDVLNKIMR